MNLKKQQLVAVSLAVCCAAALPMQAEAKKKENKTAGKPQIVVSSVPQPRAQKQVLVQKTLLKRAAHYGQPIIGTGAQCYGRAAAESSKAGLQGCEKSSEAEG